MVNIQSHSLQENLDFKENLFEVDLFNIFQGCIHPIIWLIGITILQIAILEFLLDDFSCINVKICYLMLDHFLMIILGNISKVI